MIPGVANGNLEATVSTAAWCAWPWARCCWEDTRAQPAGRIDAAAPSPNGCRRPVGHGQRPCLQAVVPLRAVPGARPASVWRSSAKASHGRCAPQATWQRGAPSAPAPGTASNQGQSG
jgi:hypothetical protein